MKIITKETIQEDQWLANKQLQQLLSLMQKKECEQKAVPSSVTFHANRVQRLKANETTGALIINFFEQHNSKINTANIK